ncbi:MAG TPA: hypothetical protein ENG78_00900 [Acidiferrobacteraceae bacterium]|nr:hypothetical protein [Acidiferrobacteraceae bacterium]HEX19375.1 hypothetical protein [Acidiferrobacteraceae bacterium]
MDNDLTYNKLASDEKEMFNRLLESDFPGRGQIREQVFVGWGEVRTPTYQLMDNDLTYNKLASNEKEMFNRLLESDFPGRGQIREQVFVGWGEVRTPTYQPHKELRSGYMCNRQSKISRGTISLRRIWLDDTTRHSIWGEIMTDVGVRTSPQPTG